ncbi:MAG: DUF5606 domain-containing protein [Crocinitomicaceae bacterium]|nr:DUF5606 domain-containing protein [Crocinitomicaceae bacterium]MDG1777574.1 DUF5606 domain-containing protein [Crocinitomicaceae bacterium]
MDLSGIISISGRPGLFKVVAQGKSNIIVESLTDKKRFPAYSADRISALDDISIYTHENDKPIKEIFKDILTKTQGKEAISHKESINTLIEFLSDILPNYDEDRVYPSDIKKLFQWFNLLVKSGHLKLEVKEAPKKKSPAKKKETKEKEDKPKKAVAKKKTPAKKTAAKGEKPKAKSTVKK